MSYIQTFYDDWNRDGVYDRMTRKYVTTDASGKTDYQVIETDDGNDGVLDNRETNHFGYDDQGRQNWQWDTIDHFADGTWDIESYRHIEYDDYGRVRTDRLSSPDMDGDNLADYSQTMTCSYNAAGNVTSKETLYYFNDVQSTLDYRLETFTYNDKGLLAEAYVDDWALYDFVIGRQYTYNGSGQVTKVKVMDEYVFGDSNWHNAETYKYSKTGQLIESNLYDEWFNDSRVLEIKTKFTYNADGTVKSELATGQDFNWKTVERQLTEHWYDANGRETHKLISFDENLDGKWDQGTRTLIQTAYNEAGEITYQSTDFNAGDGWIEHLMTTEMLLA